jgi:hypothetical protein
LLTEALKDLTTRDFPSLGDSILNQKELVEGGVSLAGLLSTKRAGIMREPDLEPKHEMKKRASIPADPAEAADQILNEATSRNITVKLLGGLAFKRICPSSKEGALARNNNDVDLAVKRNDVSKLKKLMDELGYEYPLRANVTHPDQILYIDNQNRRQVDIFVDGFQMCHKLDFRKGLEGAGQTLPITELIMTKLQIVEITDKDLQDLCAAFFDFRLGQEAGNIRYNEIARLASRNWGIWKDFTTNLANLKERASVLAPDKANVVAGRVDELLKYIEKRPKSARWGARALIGERLQWHELPQKR